MTKHNIIRILAGLSFLIFFCPFFQMCSESSRLKKELVEKPKTQSDIIKEQERQEKERVEFNEAFTYSGYKMATYAFEPQSFKDIDTNDFLDSTFYAIVSFTIILIVSIILFILSLKKKFTAVYKLSLLNLLLAIIPIVIFLTNGVLEEISQIKFGYYLFVLNTLALIIFSKKSKIPDAV